MELLFESPLRSYLDLGEAPTWIPYRLLTYEILFCKLAA